MAFFDDLFGAVTGQQVAPQQTIIPTDQLISQGYGTATGLLPQVGAYNSALVNATIPSQLQAEALYDPNAAALRSTTSRSILDQLNLGSSMSPELQNEITRNLLSTNAATGFGASAGGVGGVLYQTALDKQNLLRQRQQDALGAVRSSPSLSSLFQPDRGVSPSVIAAGIQGEQAARDEYANMQEDIRRQNFSSLINTGGRILGTVAGGVAGAFLGNPAMGASAGGAIGGQLIKGSSVAGRQRAQQNQFTSPLAGLFSSALSRFGTQGNYGTGSGGFYGIGANEYDQGADLGMGAI